MTAQVPCSPEDYPSTTLLPNAVAMMCGVWRIIRHDATDTELTYTDGTDERARVRGAVDWRNPFSVVSAVQARRHDTEEPSGITVCEGIRQRVRAESAGGA